MPPHHRRSRRPPPGQRARAAGPRPGGHRADLPRRRSAGASRAAGPRPRRSPGSCPRAARRWSAGRPRPRRRPSSAERGRPATSMAGGMAATSGPRAPSRRRRRSASSVLLTTTSAARPKASGSRSTRVAWTTKARRLGQECRSHGEVGAGGAAHDHVVRRANELAHVGGLGRDLGAELAEQLFGHAQEPYPKQPAVTPSAAPWAGRGHGRSAYVVERGAPVRADPSPRGSPERRPLRLPGPR